MAWSSRSASRAPASDRSNRGVGETASASSTQQALPTGFYFRPLSQRPTLAVAAASRAGAGLASSRSALEAQVFSEMLTSRHASASDKLKAATELGNLALQDAESSEIISDAGAVPPLVVLTRAGTTREQRERAAGALRNLAAHSDKNKRAIVDAGGVRHACEPIEPSLRMLDAAAGGCSHPALRETADRECDWRSTRRASSAGPRTRRPNARGRQRAPD